MISCVFAGCVIDDDLPPSELMHAIEVALERAIDDAIRLGGLDDAKTYLEAGIAEELARNGYSLDVKIIRENEIDMESAFFFEVAAGNARCRFYIDGVRDPLIGIRLGAEYALQYRIRQCPFSPYEQHGNYEVRAECLTHHYYHVSRDGSDLFARLENKTSDGRYYGFEVLITDDPLSCGRSCADHIYLSKGTQVRLIDEKFAFFFDDSHCAKYGIATGGDNIEV